jgi:MFS family permease
MAPLLTASGYEFAPEERPTFPGSPAIPRLSLSHRVRYATVGFVLAASTTFGNALLNVNVATIAGDMGWYVSEASWLPAIYVAMNASANLTLVKARTQFGIPVVTLGLLLLYALAAVWQFILPGFASAAAIRAICGASAAALATLTIYYLLQAFPGRLRPLALVVGMGLIQLGTPLARLIPLEVLAVHHWLGLYAIEGALACLLLALIITVPLPPSERSAAFEPADLLSIALLVPAYLLLCGVLGEGRLLWWTDTIWLGECLMGAVVLIAVAVSIEKHRARPLLQLDWIGTRDILRFALVALFMRVALAEQTYAAVGLLTSGGLTNDQLHTLFAIVVAAMVCGVICAALTLSERRIPYQVATAALLIAAAAWFDSDVTNLTRPEQLYVSQAMLGFGTTLFVGPALVFGFIRMSSRGATHLVTFVVLFSTTQNVGGLAGSALLGTYQTIATHSHTLALAESTKFDDPQVISRVQAGAAAIQGVVTDSSQRAGQSVGILGQAMAREASILAYQDVFRLVALAGVSIALYVVGVSLFMRWHRRTTPGAP